MTEDRRPTGKEEILAQVLHEAGREAVEKNQVVRDDVPVRPFVEWPDLTENAKEGRRSQARYLLNHGVLGGYIHSAIDAALTLKHIKLFRKEERHLTDDMRRVPPLAEVEALLDERNSDPDAPILMAKGEKP